MRRVSLLLSFVGLLVVTGCAAEPAPSEKPTKPSPAPVEKPAPKPEPAPVEAPHSAPAVIPPCEELVTSAVLRLRLGDYFEYLPESEQSESSLYAAMGPAAKAAIEQSLQSLNCSWGIPNSDGFNSVLVSELPSQARADLIAALRDSDFVETETAGVPTFVLKGKALIGPGYMWYAFVDDILISSLASSDDGDLGAEVASSLQLANQ